MTHKLNFIYDWSITKIEDDFDTAVLSIFFDWSLQFIQLSTRTYQIFHSRPTTTTKSAAMKALGQLSQEDTSQLQISLPVLCWVSIQLSSGAVWPLLLATAGHTILSTSLSGSCHIGLFLLLDTWQQRINNATTQNTLTAKTKKPTAPGVPRRSPIQVLSWPDNA